MIDDGSPNNFVQMAVLVGSALAATVGLISFLGFGLLGLVAWADYSDRGCFEAPGQQCDDARYMMIYPALCSIIGLIVMVVAGWFTLRLFRRLQRAFGTS
ncbi:hypothetical protein [Rhizobium sp. WYJ-E13]|uniref:hypothetical protein n=1 Tax=Rhizobium sp. WYJ-E13 TaxID=2849093 RepID=UPI001C1EC8BA|nr:hypothetical protein [Rhizobium sp. WYJ-E13]QWW69691.1 hypothetical protein KQ933_08295 [Rhizobium sp. WYJ-E13]